MLLISINSFEGQYEMVGRYQEQEFSRFRGYWRIGLEVLAFLVTAPITIHNGKPTQRLHEPEVRSWFNFQPYTSVWFMVRHDR